MLCLTRRKNERIVIGDIVKVTVIEILDGKVRLGIDAPKDISIYRQEVWERIKAAGESADQVIGRA